MHPPFAEFLEPDGQSEDWLVIFLDAEVGCGDGAELFVMLGSAAVHGTFKIKDDMFLPCQFECFEY